MAPLKEDNTMKINTIRNKDLNQNEDNINKSIDNQVLKEKLSFKSEIKSSESEYQLRIVWFSVFKLTLVHVIGFYGFYCAVFEAKYLSFIWSYLVAVGSGFGVLSGAHRLWSHKCYKAHYSLRVLLMILQTLALQNHIYEWCRDHRVHHKYAETNADPHNAKRGFFFSHMGWLMAKKHPQVIEKGRNIDMSDLMSDPIVRFQRKYYMQLVIIIWGIIPTLVPIYFWSETLVIAFALNMSRYIVSLHQAWLVNSAAHMTGLKPYDRHIASVENQSVVYLSFGEGYHNYHHTFPYDYSASEYGWKSNFNLATLFIDFFALIGLAYNRKVATKTAIENRKKRTGEALTVPKNNRFLDYVYGLVLTTWPVWVPFTLRAVVLSHMTKTFIYSMNFVLGCRVKGRGIIHSTVKGSAYQNTDKDKHQGIDSSSKPNLWKSFYQNLINRNQFY